MSDKTGGGATGAASSTTQATSSSSLSTTKPTTPGGSGGAPAGGVASLANADPTKAGAGEAAAPSEAEAAAPTKQSNPEQEAIDAKAKKAKADSDLTGELAEMAGKALVGGLTEFVQLLDHLKQANDDQKAGKGDGMSGYLHERLRGAGPDQALASQRNPDDIASRAAAKSQREAKKQAEAKAATSKVAQDTNVSKTGKNQFVTSDSKPEAKPDPKLATAALATEAKPQTPDKPTEAAVAKPPVEPKPAEAKPEEAAKPTEAASEAEAKTAEEAETDAQAKEALKDGAVIAANAYAPGSGAIVEQALKTEQGQQLLDKAVSQMPQEEKEQLAAVNKTGALKLAKMGSGGGKGGATSGATSAAPSMPSSAPAPSTPTAAPSASASSPAPSSSAPKPDMNMKAAAPAPASKSSTPKPNETKPQSPRPRSKSAPAASSGSANAISGPPQGQSKGSSGKFASLMENTSNLSQESSLALGGNKNEDPAHKQGQPQGQPQSMATMGSGVGLKGGVTDKPGPAVGDMKGLTNSQPAGASGPGGSGLQNQNDKGMDKSMSGKKAGLKAAL